MGPDTGEGKWRRWRGTCRREWVGGKANPDMGRGAMVAGCMCWKLFGWSLLPLVFLLSSLAKGNEAMRAIGSHGVRCVVGRALGWRWCVHPGGVSRIDKAPSVAAIRVRLCAPLQNGQTADCEGSLLATILLVTVPFLPAIRCLCRGLWQFRSPSK